MGPGLTDGVVVVAVVVVVVLVVVGLLILIVGPPLPPQATVKDTMAMLIARVRKADRRMFRSFTSRSRP